MTQTQTRRASYLSLSHFPPCREILLVSSLLFIQECVVAVKFYRRAKKLTIGRFFCPSTEFDHNNTFLYIDERAVTLLSIHLQVNLRSCGNKIQRINFDLLYKKIFYLRHEHYLLNYYFRQRRLIKQFFQIAIFLSNTLAYNQYSILCLETLMMMSFDLLAKMKIV